jgi:tetratricopeptide (TPR) repeat protein
VEKPDALAFVGLAEARSAIGDRTGAAEALAAAVRVDPVNTSANYQLGAQHFETGEQLWNDGKKEAARERFREAIGRFDKVLSTSPNFGKAILLKGVALNRFLGRPEEGLALIRRYIELRPEISEGYLLYGQALADSGRKTEAVAALRHAVEMAEPGDRRAADLLDKLTGAKPDHR